MFEWQGLRDCRWMDFNLRENVLFRWKKEDISAMSDGATRAAGKYNFSEECRMGLEINVRY